MKLTMLFMLAFYAVAASAMDGDIEGIFTDVPYQNFDNIVDENCKNTAVSSTQVIEKNEESYGKKVEEPSKSSAQLAQAGLKIAIDQLVLQCDSYSLYLNKMFGCGLCKGVNAVFNAKAYDHATIRKQQLLWLMSLLKTPYPGTIHNFHAFVKKLSFTGAVGRAFKVSCEQTLLPRLNLEPTPPEEPCVICLDSEQEIYTLPCQHFAMCTKCYYQHVPPSCPMCRVTITKHGKIAAPLTSFCMICGSPEPNMVNQSCGHLVVCEACSKTIKLCALCGQGSAKFIRVFR